MDLFTNRESEFGKDDPRVHLSLSYETNVVDAAVPTAAAPLPKNVMSETDAQTWYALVAATAAEVANRPIRLRRSPVTPNRAASPSSEPLLSNSAPDSATPPPHTVDRTVSPSPTGFDRVLRLTAVGKASCSLVSAYQIRAGLRSNP